MNKKQFDKNISNLGILCAASLVSAILSLMGWGIFKIKIIYFFVSLGVAFICFIITFIHMLIWGEKYYEEYEDNNSD